MNWLKRKTFPFLNELTKGFKFQAAISILIFIILLLFEPFGLQYIENNEILILFGYALITYISLFLNFNVIPKILPVLFNDNNWTILREIIYIGWVLFFIAIGNFYYTVLWANMPADPVSMASMILKTLKVAIFPVIGFVLLKQILIAKRHASQAKRLNKIQEEKNTNEKQDKKVWVFIQSENKSENFTLNISNLLYVAACENYVEIHWLESKKKKKLIRCSLSAIESQLKKFKEIAKCHRSYIINLNQIKHIEGNAQGMQITLHDSDQKIPVARNRVKFFKNRFEKVNN